MKNLSIKPILVLSALLAFASCGDSEEENETSNVSIAFAALVDGADANCDTDYSVGTENTSAKLADARVFISEVELKNAEGNWVAMTLTQNDWQYENIALLDFENGSGACKDSGTPEMNKNLIGDLPEGDYSAIRFSLGVPFEFNHIDNATAPAPLNTPGMFWVWQGGYKFVRVDWIVDGGDVPRFNTHLGSTACDSTAPTAPPEERCGRPNMAKFELPITDLDSTSISLDLETMIATTDVSTNIVDSPPGCMSNPAEGGDCEGIFTTLGLDFSSGTCMDNCGAQTTFSVDK